MDEQTIFGLPLVEVDELRTKQAPAALKAFEYKGWRFAKVAVDMATDAKVLVFTRLVNGRRAEFHLMLFDWESIPDDSVLGNILDGLKQYIDWHPKYN